MFRTLHKYTELRSLSFDIGWLSDDSTMANVVHRLPRGLEKLTKLEELYLSDCEFSISDLSFAESLESLKHLQISTIDRNQGGPVGFDSLVNLESLTLFGVPDKATVAELKQLPKLEQLVIVDVLNDLKTATSKERQKSQLESALPGANIQVIPFGEDRPKPPAKFQEHLKEVPARILAKLEQEQNQVESRE